MKPIVYVDMDDVLCAYTPAHSAALAADPNVLFPQSVPGFFLSLPPIAGAIDAVHRLRQRCELYVLSAPSTRNPHCYSEKRIWIEEHFDYPLAKRLILSSDKGLLKGDYLIDDHADGKGQERFEGRVIHFGTTSFPDWAAVIQFLQERGIA